MLDALGIPHSPAETRQLFQSAVGMDVYSYLQVILFPQEAKASDFERILKRPNKFLTNQLIAQAKDWHSFLATASAPDPAGVGAPKAHRLHHRHRAPCSNGAHSGR